MCICATQGTFQLIFVHNLTGYPVDEDARQSRLYMPTRTVSTGHEAFQRIPAWLCGPGPIMNRMHDGTQQFQHFPSFPGPLTAIPTQQVSAFNMMPVGNDVMYAHTLGRPLHVSHTTGHDSGVHNFGSQPACASRMGRSEVPQSHQYSAANYMNAWSSPHTPVKAKEVTPVAKYTHSNTDGILGQPTASYVFPPSHTSIKDMALSTLQKAATTGARAGATMKVLCQDIPKEVAHVLQRECSLSWRPDVGNLRIAPDVQTTNTSLLEKEALSICEIYRDNLKTGRPFPKTVKLQLALQESPTKLTVPTAEDNTGVNINEVSQESQELYNTFMQQVQARECAPDDMFGEECEPQDAEDFCTIESASHSTPSVSARAPHNEPKPNSNNITFAGAASAQHTPLKPNANTESSFFGSYANASASREPTSISAHEQHNTKTTQKLSRMYSKRTILGPYSCLLDEAPTSSSEFLDRFQCIHDDVRIRQRLPTRQVRFTTQAETDAGMGYRSSNGATCR